MAQAMRVVMLAIAISACLAAQPYAQIDRAPWRANITHPSPLATWGSDIAYSKRKRASVPTFSPGTLVGHDAYP
jgi:hypothetical protein